MTRILGRVLSRSVQSSVTIWRTLVISSVAMTFNLSSPITCRALLLAASASSNLSFGSNGFGNKLANRRVELLGRLSIPCILFVQRRLNRLEKGDIVANLRCLVTRRAEGKCE